MIKNQLNSTLNKLQQRAKKLQISILLSFSCFPSSLSGNELDQHVYANETIVPSPACLCAAPNGTLFVGVDLLGSLGKGPGKGKIIRLTDLDNDRKADKHTVFAEIDNPRGLITVGDKLFVLHTVIPKDTGVLEAMHLSVLEDKDKDGKADGPSKVLIKNISCKTHNIKRGADHTTNGIRLGIDGWIYIAVGDFGFVDAIGTDGKTSTLLGGGILRVRPDGTEMEMFTTGMRNIYDIAIDPFMNVYTRGNTNDGGGWNVRFIHHIQSGFYGYPTHYKGFTNEIIPALVDLGGGSGTGSVFIQEPSWPTKYNNVPMMADWGRSKIYVHRLKEDGPSFTQKEEAFLDCHQIADLDVDASGRMYLAAWAGAGYKGNSKIGHVEIVTPKGWKYKPSPDFTKTSKIELLNLLKSRSATIRLHASQHLLNSSATVTDLLPIANNSSLSLETRTAAIFTLAQLNSDKVVPALTSLTEIVELEEISLRCLSDRKFCIKSAPLAPFYKGLRSTNKRVQAAAIVGLGRLGKKEAAKHLLEVTTLPENQISAEEKNGVAPKVLKGKETWDIDINVKSFKQGLFLITEPTGEEATNGHATWINPRFVIADGTEIPATSLKWFNVKGSEQKAKIDQTSNGDPITLNGKKVKGFSTSGKNIIKLNIRKRKDWVRFKATAALTEESKGKGSVAFSIAMQPSGFRPGNEGPHATPNSSIILPHLAVKALRELNAHEACLDSVKGKNQDVALWALRYMHTKEVVDGLINKLNTASEKKLKLKIVHSLARLATREKTYLGDWWWGTQPDTRGPYYKAEYWEESKRILSTIDSFQNSADAATQKTISQIKLKNRTKVLIQKGPVAKTIADTSIEDVILGLEKHKGNLANGLKLLTNKVPEKAMACAGCHIMSGDTQNGYPSMSNIGSILNREAIAEAILKPEASIAYNWYQVEKKDGTKIIGTLFQKGDKHIEIVQIGGIKSKIAITEIKSHGKQTSTLMGPHLADKLTMQEFTDIVDYLFSQKEKKQKKK